STEVQKPLKAPLAGAFLFSAVRDGGVSKRPLWLWERMASSGEREAYEPVEAAGVAGRNPWDIIAGPGQNMGAEDETCPYKNTDGLRTRVRSAWHLRQRPIQDSLHCSDLLR